MPPEMHLERPRQQRIRIFSRFVSLAVRADNLCLAVLKLNELARLYVYVDIYLCESCFVQACNAFGKAPPGRASSPLVDTGYSHSLCYVRASTPRPLRIHPQYQGRKRHKLRICASLFTFRLVSVNYAVGAFSCSSAPLDVATA
jgi:hypothetical protein